LIVLTIAKWESGEQAMECGQDKISQTSIHDHCPAVTLVLTEL